MLPPVSHCPRIMVEEVGVAGNTTCSLGVIFTWLTGPSPEGIHFSRRHDSGAETAHLVRDKGVTDIQKKHVSFLLSILQFERDVLDFPSGPVVKNPPAKAGDMGSIPGPGGSRGK